MENVELSDLGHAHRVVANKDNCTIVGGKGDKKKLIIELARLKIKLNT